MVVCGIGQRARSGNQLNRKLRIKANTAKVPAGVSLVGPARRFIVKLDLLLARCNARALLVLLIAVYVVVVVVLVLLLLVVVIVLTVAHRLFARNWEA